MKYREVLNTIQNANPLGDSLRKTRRLSNNFVPKSVAIKNGWKPGKVIGIYIPGGQISGDVFDNIPPLLPMKHGRVWYEADVCFLGTMSRAKQPGTRLLYSSDGLLYITKDHYNTLHKIGSY